MTIKIPYTIKVQVLKEWIQGFSRDKIAKENSIGTGTVTSIIQQTKRDIPDIYLMRELALKIQKENLDINYFASSVRLKKVLDRLELSEEKIEEFLEEISIYCFKQQINEKEFILKIDKVSNLADNLELPIPDIPFLINQLTKQVDELRREIATKQNQMKQQMEEYKITVTDLKDYRLKRPLLEKTHELEKILDRKNDEISIIMKELMDFVEQNEKLKSSKVVSESEFIEMNKKLPVNNPLNIKELTKITEEIFYHPSRYVEIIKLIRDHYPINSKEKITNLSQKDKTNKI
ncbi:MAG: hypothetical protein ABJB76_11955 [Candidatus Nitrosocosmicus sp.]